MEIRHQRDVHIKKKYTARTESLLDRKKISEKSERERRGIKRKTNNLEPLVCINPGFR